MDGETFKRGFMLIILFRDKYFIFASDTIIYYEIDENAQIYIKLTYFTQYGLK